MTTTEYQRRPDRINVIRLTDENAAEAATIVGGYVDDEGTLIVPLYGEGSAVPVTPGAYVWIDESGPRVETDPDRFARMWAEVTDGPTLRDRVDALEQIARDAAEAAAQAQTDATNALEQARR